MRSMVCRAADRIFVSANREDGSNASVGRLVARKSIETNQNDKKLSDRSREDEASSLQTTTEDDRGAASH